MSRHSLGEKAGYLEKYNKKRDRYLKYDFMPALLEVIERPSHIAGKIIIFAITMLVVTAFLWAYFARIDVVVNGQGMIVARENNSTIVSLCNGEVSNIYVQDGSLVKKGDVLMELDTAEIDTYIKTIERQMHKLEVKKEILSIYMEDLETEIQAEDYDEEYASLVNGIILENEIYHEQIKLYPTETEYITLQYKQLLAEDADSVENELEQSRFQLERYENEMSQMVIYSPISGVVSDMVLHNPGENVLASAALMKIVPEEPSLIFQSYIFDKDISDIKVGDQVQIKLQAYPFADYGAVYGSIYSISEEAKTIEGVGNVYVTEITFDEGLNDNILLRQGLTGMAEIKIGTRSVMEYFLEPITDGLSNSLKENG